MMECAPGQTALRRAAAEGGIALSPAAGKDRPVLLRQRGGGVAVSPVPGARRLAALVS